ncbi:hypothetical protein ANABIO32_39180 [Rossellomorea marisflavi]|nr:hypothetical protein ANABIO32_39180 [Rossellomorea marisflavi]
MDYCKQKGILIGKNGATVAGFNNVLALSPPLVIEEDDLDLMLEAVVEGISRL